MILSSKMKNLSRRYYRSKKFHGHFRFLYDNIVLNDNIGLGDIIVQLNDNIVQGDIIVSQNDNIVRVKNSLRNWTFYPNQSNYPFKNSSENFHSNESNFPFKNFWDDNIDLDDNIDQNDNIVLNLVFKNNLDDIIVQKQLKTKF